MDGSLAFTRFKFSLDSNNEIAFTSFRKLENILLQMQKPTLSLSSNCLAPIARCNEPLKLSSNNGILLLFQPELQSAYFFLFYCLVVNTVV